jgi:hypothetical protein
MSIALAGSHRPLYLQLYLQWIEQQSEKYSINICEMYKWKLRPGSQWILLMWCDICQFSAFAVHLPEVPLLLCLKSFPKKSPRSVWAVVEAGHALHVHRQTDRQRHTHTHEQG